MLFAGFSFTDCQDANPHLNNLKGSSGKNITGWIINATYYQQQSHYPACMNNRNWHGFHGDDEIGSIKTTLHGCGSAQLDFGNCYYEGITQVRLNGELIGEASTNTPSKVIEFDYNDGAILELQELNTAIIVFNDLSITKCNTC